MNNLRLPMFRTSNQTYPFAIWAKFGKSLLALFFSLQLVEISFASQDSKQETCRGHACGLKINVDPKVQIANQNEWYLSASQSKELQMNQKKWGQCFEGKTTYSSLTLHGSAQSFQVKITEPLQIKSINKNSSCKSNLLSYFRFEESSEVLALFADGDERGFTLSLYRARDISGLGHKTFGLVLLPSSRLTDRMMKRFIPQAKILDEKTRESYLNDEYLSVVGSAYYGYREYKQMMGHTFAFPFRNRPGVPYLLPAPSRDSVLWDLNRNLKELEAKKASYSEQRGRVYVSSWADEEILKIDKEIVSLENVFAEAANIRIWPTWVSKFERCSEIDQAPVGPSIREFESFNYSQECQLFEDFLEKTKLYPNLEVEARGFYHDLAGWKNYWKASDSLRSKLYHWALNNLKDDLRSQDKVLVNPFDETSELEQ